MAPVKFENSCEQFSNFSEVKKTNVISLIIIFNEMW